MPVELTAVTNCPSKRGSRDWITPYRSSKVMLGMLTCPSLPRSAASDWRKSDTAVGGLIATDRHGSASVRKPGATSILPLP